MEKPVLWVFHNVVSDIEMDFMKAKALSQVSLFLQLDLQISGGQVESWIPLKARQLHAKGNRIGKASQFLVQHIWLKTFIIRNEPASAHGSQVWFDQRK